MGPPGASPRPVPFRLCSWSILWSIVFRGQGSLELASPELSWVLILGLSELEGICRALLLRSTRLARIEGVVTEIQRELNEVKVLSDSRPPRPSYVTRSGRGFLPSPRSAFESPRY